MLLERGDGRRIGGGLLAEVRRAALPGTSCVSTKATSVIPSSGARAPRAGAARKRRKLDEGPSRRRVFPGGGPRSQLGAVVKRPVMVYREARRQHGRHTALVRCRTVAEMVRVRPIVLALALTGAGAAAVLVFSDKAAVRRVLLPRAFATR